MITHFAHTLKADSGQLKAHAQRGLYYDLAGVLDEKLIVMRSLTDRRMFLLSGMLG